MGTQPSPAGNANQRLLGTVSMKSLLHSTVRKKIKYLSLHKFNNHNLTFFPSQGLKLFIVTICNKKQVLNNKCLNLWK